jgi:hypothetical protein
VKDVMDSIVSHHTCFSYGQYFKDFCLIKRVHTHLPTVQKCSHSTVFAASGDQVREGDMAGECGVHQRDEECVQDFVWGA